MFRAETPALIRDPKDGRSVPHLRYSVKNACKDEQHLALNGIYSDGEPLSSSNWTLYRKLGNPDST